MALRIEDAGFIPGHYLAGGPRPHRTGFAADEGMQQFGGAQALGHLDTGGRLPLRARVSREHLAGGNALPEAVQLRALGPCGHLAVEGGRGKAHGGPVLGNARQQ